MVSKLFFFPEGFLGFVLVFGMVSKVFFSEGFLGFVLVFGMVSKVFFFFFFRGFSGVSSGVWDGF